MTIDSIEYEDLNGELDDLEDVDGVVKCPICRSPNVRLESKCITCEDCGWSKCEIYG